MAKITNSEINDLGFTWEMFGLDNKPALDTYIDRIIISVSAVLNGILGSGYDSVAEPTQGRVKRAEECLVAAELLQRRINRLLSNVTGAGEELNTGNEKEQKESYLEEARDLVDMMLGYTGFSFSAPNTSHFDDSAELGGLEVLE